MRAYMPWYFAVRGRIARVGMAMARLRLGIVRNSGTQQ